MSKHYEVMVGDNAVREVVEAESFSKACAKAVTVLNKANREYLKDHKASEDSGEPFEPSEITKVELISETTA